MIYDAIMSISVTVCFDATRTCPTNLPFWDME
jgi:hypothetical protein